MAEIITESRINQNAADTMDAAVAALLDAAEDVVNAAGPEIVAEIERDRGRRRFARGGHGGKRRWLFGRRR